ncbi:MAG: FAD-binding protein [Cyclobacteriaceae bacterium]|nr:FAD-binding protein [Cyclobacteriaceae bacterium]
MDEIILKELAATLDGEFHTDLTYRSLYATDASAYRELPLAVAIPKNPEDIRKIIIFASKNGTSVIPRTAGTSLAGQVVGNGIIVDVSKYMTHILEVNPDQRWVKVEPGIVRDDLNYLLKEDGLFFGPETATANRAMIGGMVGNNSCGSNSIVYGSTREHLLSLKMILSDGNEVEFGPLGQNEYEDKLSGKTCVSSLENDIYRTIHQILTDPDNREEIIREFPKPSIPRRNTGYAIDLLLRAQPFTTDGPPFNLCRLIAGSEGTLGFITEIKVNLEPLPPPEKALICAHFNSLYESLEANLIALKYSPSASELIDHYILDCTKENITQRKNRFFIKGDPRAILIVELANENKGKLDKNVKELITELKAASYGYHYPVLYGEDMVKIWSLRKAGLGLLGNIPGDAKPVPVVEDSAVDVLDLPAYIREFDATLEKYGLYCVHYAHAGTGELHLRPIINLKTSEGQKLFKTVLEEVSKLVKKYKGSLSGEHGDGRLRGEFIPFMIGQKNYGLLERVKNSWDPKNIFNPGKIVRTPSMNTSLRYQPDQKTREISTYFDFSKNQGILRAAEQCNGSGDCRKTHISGGTMCPSYMATRNEKDTTRARANILREMLTNSSRRNPFNHQEILEVMDLYLSCKGCKSECPSNVDVAKLKAEFLQHYYETNGVPLRASLIANIGKINRINSIFPGLYNQLINHKRSKKFLSRIIGFSTERSLPGLNKITLKHWAARYPDKLKSRVSERHKKILLYADEFTNYHDVNIGVDAIDLLTRLGYEIIIPELKDSGRTYLSKGLVKKAGRLAEKNIELMDKWAGSDIPLIGLEPSAILTFRDEYLELLSGKSKDKARALAERVFTFEEFFAREIASGEISKNQFTDKKTEILVHGHCYQKALSSQSFSRQVLSIPENFSVRLIPSGCCGMAGSFGFEKEHYQISMEIGELVLFPAVRKADSGTVIAAAGTSCRHQILDGTGTKALHPVQILKNALKVP